MEADLDTVTKKQGEFPSLGLVFNRANADVNGIYSPRTCRATPANDLDG